MAPIVAPFQQALSRLKEAVHRAMKSPSLRNGRALREAAARLSAAAREIGVPECALGTS